ncbi:unnamed protein product [Brassica oleracea var. botrytis]
MRKVQMDHLRWAIASVPKKEKLLTVVMRNLSQALAQLNGTLILRTMDVSC